MLFVGLLLLIFAVLGFAILQTQRKSFESYLNERMEAQTKDMVMLVEQHYHNRMRQFEQGMNAASAIAAAEMRIDSALLYQMAALSHLQLTLYYPTADNRWQAAVVADSSRITPLTSAPTIDETLIGKGVKRVKTTNGWAFEEYRYLRNRKGDVINVLQAVFPEKDLFELRNIFKSRTYFNGAGFAYAVAEEDSILLIHPNPDLEGGKISKGASAWMWKIRNGSHFYIDRFGKEKYQYFDYFAPYQMFVAISISVAEAIAKPLRFIQQTIILSLIGGILLAFAGAYWLIKGFATEINQLAASIEQMAQGDFSMRFATKRRDEIRLIVEALNQLVCHLQKAVQFVQQISKREYDKAVLHVVNPNDVLSYQLLAMRDSLRQYEISEKEQQKITQIIARLSERLAQLQDATPEQIGREGLREVTQVTQALQGCLFIAKSGNLHLVATFAHSRERFAGKRILAPGEGLIGQVFLEQQPQWIANMPASYTSVVTGLHEIKPASLLIVPLKSAGHTVGVMEIGFMKSLSSLHHDFVLKAAEIIGTAIRNSQ